MGKSQNPQLLPAVQGAALTIRGQRHRQSPGSKVHRTKLKRKRFKSLNFILSHYMALFTKIL